LKICWAKSIGGRDISLEETLGGGADGGVDLILRRDSEVTLVQCKRWSGKPVPVRVVREIYGILADRRASAAKVVATTSFTPDAITFARGKPIELVDSTNLLNLLRGVQSSGNVAEPQIDSQRNHVAPDCPRCGCEMKVREAHRGANAGQRFWGCSKYPSCRGTRAI
jgi:restriction system protein